MEYDSTKYQSRITIEPGKRSGKPCIRGMRITVYDVLEYLASGMSVDEVLVDFPDLTRDDIAACLAFAADRERHSLVVAVKHECPIPREQYKAITEFSIDTQNSFLVLI